MTDYIIRLTEDGPRVPTLNQIFWTFVPFAIMLSLALMLAIVDGEPALSRTQNTIRASLVLATPALFLFVLFDGNRPLGNYWRLFWTFSMLTYLVHYWYGQYILFNGDIGATFTDQGLVVALSNFIVTVFWLLDVIACWVTRRRPEWIIWPRRAIHLLVFVSFATSTILFRTGTIQLLGIAMAVVVAAAVFARVTHLVGAGETPMCLPWRQYPPMQGGHRPAIGELWAQEAGRE